MNLRPVRTAVAALCLSMIGGLLASAGGVYFGIPGFTLDLAATLPRIPIAADAAFDALEDAAEDWGVPPAELADMKMQFDQAVAGIAEFADQFPTWIPLPALGGGIEIGLPLVVIDGVRICGGWLSDELIRSLCGLAGTEIPRPLARFEMEFGETTGSVTADLDFLTWGLSTDVVKRVDLLILALEFGAGVSLFRGSITPQVSYDLPAELGSGAAAALDELHLDELTWSEFAMYGVVGFELGPPFLRLYGDVRWTIPLSQSTGWWELRPGPVSALLGFVIRF